MLEWAGLAPSTVGTFFRLFSSGWIAMEVDALGIGLLLGRHHVLLDVVRQSQSGTLTNPGMEVSTFAPLVTTPWATVIRTELLVQTSRVPVLTTSDATLYFPLEMFDADLLSSWAIIFPHAVVIP